MASIYIAGHIFEMTPKGRVCTAHSTRLGGTCNIRWIDIRNCDEADIDTVEGLAHTGKLNAAEIASIRTERENEDDRIWTAIQDAASAGSR